MSPPLTALLLMCVSLSHTARILSWPSLNCSQQGLRCTVTTSNCMDMRWHDVNLYTPSSPEELQASVDTRPDESGHLQPVLLANWKIKDDGSISHLTATELHVLVTSTNQNLCVRYSFKDRLKTMRSPSGEKWSFSAYMIVLEPGQMYRVSVFNIPKPELGHSSYDISTDVIVPGCQDVTMQKTQFCIESGSLWQPNISVAQVRAVGGGSGSGSGSVLAVSFSPDRMCEEYIVIVSCLTSRNAERAYKNNQTSLNVTFDLDKWPRSCCHFDVEIKPLFPECGQDCLRRRTTLNICPAKTTAASGALVYVYVVLGVVFMCAVMAVIMYFICRRPGSGKPGVPAAPKGGEKTWQQQLPQPPTVLVIFSQDHHLYTDIVLKLCAFLQIKCGIKVLVDLLDSTSVSMVGRIRWLEWQRQQLKNPFDKILVLCSRGVQAKWRAMCGQGRVILWEDIMSPTDDMLTPFLNLFLPDMHQAGMLGKYMVAYFDDISGEQDVPSVLDIAVKYKLMKHFEELYFRILEIEKYQPGQVNHIEGIGGDEYFECPSGRALRNAIETFQVYQLEHPDWFEKGCLDDELITEANQLIDQLQVRPVLECVPLMRDGPPVCVREVEIYENASSVLVLAPELNTEHTLPSVAELTPVVNPEFKHHSPGPESVLLVQPVVSKPPAPGQNWLSNKEEPFSQIPTEDSEDSSLLPVSKLSSHSVLHSSLDSNPQGYSWASSMQGGHYPLSEMSHSQPVELEEHEVLEPSGKGQSSDQGYISKLSSQNETPDKEDGLVALRRLQEELFQRNVSLYGIGPEGN